jgi:hypothetical protein
MWPGLPAEVEEHDAAARGLLALDSLRAAAEGRGPVPRSDARLLPPPADR